MKLLAYGFDGETRREEFTDDKALNAKVADLKGNKLCPGYKVFTLQEIDSYTRPPEKAAAEEKDD